jgi:carbamoylphosphate synthase large subunit
VPHGVSELEEELAGRTGVALATPPAALCKRVNSKVYSRDVATAAGLRQPEGRACRTLDELAAAFAWARGLVAAGRRVVVKDAFGVSGKGLLVVDGDRRFDQLWRLVSTAADRAGSDRVGLVVEEWVPRRLDLNYQFTIGRDGSVTLDFVKEAVTRHGVHSGHRFPVALDRPVRDGIEHATALLADRLAADGYVGVVGVDAMLGGDGGLYPVVEINARNNMSTYQAVLHDRVPDGGVAVARHFAVRRDEPVPFAAVRAALDDVLWYPGARQGLVVTAFATVNAAPGEGRLYALLLAGSPAAAAAIEEQVSARLDAVPVEVRAA